MHSTGVVFVLLLLAWSSSALPCDGCDGTEVVGEISPPEEVVVVSLSDGEEFIPDDVPDDSGSSESDPSEEVVESASNDENLSAALCETNPETCGVDPTPAEVVAPIDGATASA